MKKYWIVFFLFFLCFLSEFLHTQETDKVAPVAEKIPFKMTAHEHARVDEYYWMKERENPKVIEYLKAENAYTDAILKDTKELQGKLFQEIISRIKQTDSSVPYRLRGYLYYVRYEEGKEYPIYCRKQDSQDAKEQVLLDVNKMAEGYNYYEVVGLKISSDNQMLSFAEDTVGRRKYTICFKDIASDKLLPDRIPNTSGQSIWANDNKTIFYAIRDEALRPYKILRYQLGKSESIEIFHEKDDTFYSFVTKTKSERFILIGSQSTLSSEYRFLDASSPEGEFKIFQTRERDLEYSVDHYKEAFYIHTNHNAKNFKLVKTPVDKTEKDNWVDVIAHRENVLVENFEIFSKYLVIEERENGLVQIRIMAWDNSCDYRMDFGEAAYTAYIGVNTEFDTEILRYGFNSMVTPPSVFDFHMKDKTKKLLKQQEVGGYVLGNYQSERLYAIAGDKTLVPISLVYKKSERKEDGNPFLMEGYGSYGYSSDPSFSSSLLSLLDRGMIFAIAHIRGGQEMGRSWYEDGKLLKKRNTFTDFIAWIQSDRSIQGRGDTETEALCRAYLAAIQTEDKT